MRGSGQWKGARIKTITDNRTGKTCEIKLDKDVGDFWCIIGEDNIRNSNLRTVEQWAKARLRKSDEITWIPVLEVRAPDEDELVRYGRRHRRVDDTISTSMEFSAERYWIGHTATRRWYTVPWAKRIAGNEEYLPDDELIAQASEWGVAQHYEDPNHYSNRNRASRLKMPKFKLPYREVGSDHYYLPYDEDAWAGLQVIANNIADSRRTLRALILDRNVIASLQQIAAGTKPLLLRSGEEK